MRIVAALILATTAGCDLEWSPETLSGGIDDQQGVVLARGKETYDIYCVGCHGEAGDGNGEVARFLDPKPRNFKTCSVKFASVPAGEIPRHEDLLHTVTNGLKGTAMPAFSLVPERDRNAVVEYVKSFCEKDWRSGTPVNLGRNPWSRNPQAGVTEGERVYHGYGRCWSCHPAYVTPTEMAEHMISFDMPPSEGRPDIYDGAVKDSDWGAPIKAPDFLAQRLKTGRTVDGLAKAIGTGIGGTAMPTWAGGLKPKQLWGLAYYVRDLALMRDTPEARALTAKLKSAPKYAAPTYAAPKDAVPAPTPEPAANAPQE